MVVIQPLSTCLIKPNFCFDLPHRRSTTVSLETRNPMIILVCFAPQYTGQKGTAIFLQGQNWATGWLSMMVAGAYVVVMSLVIMDIC